MKLELKIGKSVKIISNKYEKNGKFKKEDIVYIRDMDKNRDFIGVSHIRWGSIINNYTIVDYSDIEFPKEDEIYLKSLSEWEG